MSVSHIEIAEINSVFMIEKMWRQPELWVFNGETAILKKQTIFSSFNGTCVDKHLNDH